MYVSVESEMSGVYSPLLGLAVATFGGESTARGRVSIGV